MTTMYDLMMMAAIVYELAEASPTPASQGQSISHSHFPPGWVSQGPMHVISRDESELLELLELLTLTFNLQLMMPAIKQNRRLASDNSGNIALGVRRGSIS